MGWVADRAEGERESRQTPHCVCSLMRGLISQLLNPEIVTCAEIKNRTLNQLRHPQKVTLFIWFLKSYLQKYILNVTLNGEHWKVCLWDWERHRVPLVFCLLPQRASSTVEQTIKDIKFSIELKWSFVDGYRKSKRRITWINNQFIKLFSSKK